MSVALRLPLPPPPRRRRDSGIQPVSSGRFLRPEGLDSYRITGTLAVGAATTVYQARDVVLDRSVALKVLHGSLCDTPSAPRLLDEARLLATLSHPGIVAVHELGEEHPFFAMERVRGQDLHGAALPWDEVASLGAQLASALAYLHERGLVHGNLEPANVVAGEGRAKLVDFGAAHDGDPTRDVLALGALLLGVLDGDAPSAMRRTLAACAGPAPSRPSAATLEAALDEAALRSRRGKTLVRRGWAIL
jgi:serine/threonine protein kinase